jgi:sporulation protein YlmC with PRC-barrel domain
MKRDILARLLALLLVAPPMAAGQEEGIAKASELLGTSVKSVEGEELGRLRDLVLDLDDQRVRYAIVERGAKLLRYSLVHFDAAREGTHVVLHLSRERLEASPGMDPGWQGYGLVRASALLGRDVRDSQGRAIGELADIVIDWSGGKVRYALVRARNGSGPGERVPLAALAVRNGHLALER